MAKTTLEIFPVGSKVQLDEDLFGTVLSVTIGDKNSVFYEVGWWQSRSYSKDHFAENQLSLTLGEPSRIGFK
jgi:hypothetical protein